MKSAIGKLMIAMLATMLLVESCYAQATGGGGSGGGESGTNRRRTSPARKLLTLMKRPITRRSRVFLTNLSILSAARAEKVPRSKRIADAGTPLYQSPDDASLGDVAAMRRTSSWVRNLGNRGGFLPTSRVIVLSITGHLSDLSVAGCWHTLVD
jgi:hypothetical protein